MIGSSILFAVKCMGFGPNFLGGGGGGELSIF